MNFSQQLWEQIKDTSYAAILRHPFLMGVAEGTLNEDAFRHYILQDCLFLKDYSRGLAILNARTENQTVAQFCEYARDNVRKVRAMHKVMLDFWKMTAEDIEKTDKKPNCLFYTSHLLYLVYARPPYEAMGAFLPNAWLYREAAQFVTGHGASSDTLYQRWLETYADEKYSRTVDAMLDLTDQVGETLTDTQQEAVAKHFAQAAKFVWLFWDMGYTLQQWPV